MESSIDLLRIVFLVGAVLALVAKKKIGVTPGGIIVPGLLACTLISSFTAFLLTLVSSLICFAIYKFGLAGLALRRHWSTLAAVSTSLLVGLVELSLIHKYRVLEQETLFMSMIIPGLITISATKYGLRRVMLSTLAVTALTYSIVAGLVAAVSLSYLSYFDVRLGAYAPLELANPAGMLLTSLLVAIALYFRFGVRSGGYLIAPFLALLLTTAPLQFAMFAVGVLLCSLLVKTIQKLTLIIGLERFVLSLFSSYFAVSLMDFIAIQTHMATYHPAPIVLIIASAVLTNDLCLQPTGSYLKKGALPALAVSTLARSVV